MKRMLLRWFGGYWWADHTSQFWHHPSTSPTIIMWNIMGQHFFLKIIPSNFMAETRRKFWCDRVMRVTILKPTSWMWSKKNWLSTTSLVTQIQIRSLIHGYNISLDSSWNPMILGPNIISTSNMIFSVIWHFNVTAIMYFSETCY